MMILLLKSVNDCVSLDVMLEYIEASNETRGPFRLNSFPALYKAEPASFILKLLYYPNLPCIYYTTPVVHTQFFLIHMGVAS